MKRTLFMIIIVLVLVTYSLLHGFKTHSQVTKQSPTRKIELTHENRRVYGPLVEAGIEINEDSLIEVVNNRGKDKYKDLQVLWSAVAVLGTFPKDDRIVQALTPIANEEDEGLAVTALQSLTAIGDDAGTEMAINRLPGIKSPGWRMNLASVLADFGHGEIWPTVVATVLDEDATESALLRIDKFDGLTDKSGRPINVTDELTRLSPLASRKSQILIKGKIDRRIKEQKEREARKDQ